MRRRTPVWSSPRPGDPDAELTVDLAEGGILLPDGSTIDFEIDPFAKRMILAGTDELGYLLSKDAELEAWEAAHPPRIDSLAASELADQPRRGELQRISATLIGWRRMQSGQPRNGAGHGRGAPRWRTG